MDELVQRLQESEEVDRGTRRELAGLNEGEAEALSERIETILRTDSRRLWAGQILVGVLAGAVSMIAVKLMSFKPADAGLVGIGVTALISIIAIAFGQQHENYERLVGALALMEQQGALPAQIRVLRLFGHEQAKLRGPIVGPLMRRVAASLDSRTSSLPSSSNRHLQALLSCLRFHRAPSEEMLLLFDGCRAYARHSQNSALVKAVNAIPASRTLRA